MDVSAETLARTAGSAVLRTACGRSLRSGLQGPVGVCKVIEVAAAGTLKKRPSMAAKPLRKSESNSRALHRAGGKDSGSRWVRNGGTNAFHGIPTGKPRIANNAGME